MRHSPICATVVGCCSIGFLGAGACVPRAIVGSVVAAGLLGMLFLIALTFAIHDIPRVSATDLPVAMILSKLPLLRRSILGIGIPTLVANYLPQGVNVFFQSENGLPLNRTPRLDRLVAPQRAGEVKRRPLRRAHSSYPRSTQ